MKYKWLVIFLLLSLGWAFSFSASAFEIKETYPRIANYYLQPLVPKDHYDDLAKYDLLILDVDTQTINPDMFSDIEDKNKDIQFLAYLPSQSINIRDLDDWARFRKMIYNKINFNNWWLRDSNGQMIGFSETWPFLKFVNPVKGWNEYISDLVVNDVASRDIWDGIFYDMVFANLYWLNNGDIDIDQDGQIDSSEAIDNYWHSQTNDLLQKTKARINKPLVANLNYPDNYEENLNGIMMENFPAEWLGEKGWFLLMNSYLKNLPDKNQLPQIYIINSNVDNTWEMDNYREMRFGLTNTLLGDGYFSFDPGDQTHSQTWWYDEYDENLGRAESFSYNLLDQGNKEIKSGLWRRDFENGITLVNSTDQNQVYVFDQEEFEAINGTQDRRINHGAKVNLVNLKPKDGVVLLKINKEIRNTSFNNGSFIRIFNQQGNQTRNGFFTYQDNFSGNTQILITDLDNDNNDETLVNGNGVISIHQNNGDVNSFVPYNFSGSISFAVGDVNNNGINEIVTGAGFGGGPHIKIFSQDGQLLNEFMAYDQRFRGGVDVAVGDVNKDGFEEIVTGAGFTGGPHVKIFSYNGQLLNEFMAYDERFRGGVDVAVGDVNNDGIMEIITGAGPSGGPHIKVFSQDNQILSEFMAYNENDRNGIIVSSGDITGDGLDEILVGTNNL